MNTADLENPFTPTFGEVPPYMAGRDAIIADLTSAYKATKRHPNSATAITGARGSGKTALLAMAATVAESNGWVVARSVAMPGMLDDILITARREAAHLIDAGPKRRIKGIEIGQAIGVEWETRADGTNWRNEMTALLEQLQAQGAGLLIVVDEVQPKLDEMVQLVAVYQLFVTEGRKVALLLAGLPHNMLALEKDKTVSFLRRAQQYRLGRIPDFEVAEAMRRTIEGAGRKITAEALEVAVQAAGGFPFLMQLVGFRMWDANPANKAIELEDARAGVRLANAEMRERIVKVTYESLSDGDRNFLAALCKLGGRAKSSEIAVEIGKSTSYATQYKNRLLGQGIVEEDSGALRFLLPQMSEYVAERIEA